MRSKAPRPRGRCTRCGKTTRSPTSINEACTDHYCRGSFRSAVGVNDWSECPTCAATGWTGNVRCQHCQGDGWHYALRGS